MATLFVDKIDPQSGTSLEIGSSGDTFTVPSGVTVAGAMANTPAFRVYLNSNQTISQSTVTKINFDAEDYDTDNAFASNKFTPQVAGKYFLLQQLDCLVCLLPQIGKFIYIKMVQFIVVLLMTWVLKLIHKFQFQTQLY